ncbi:MAG: hypothetical protein U5K56_01275 [Halioglobus sp.]|nr:hypothetical protein [Halioglobus sp.]
MLDKSLKVLAALASILLLVSGLRWLIDPAGAAAGLGMPLLEGVGRSTQIGDLTAFFVVAGGFGLLGVLRGNGSLLYTPAALVGAAALFRILATVLHDAALATQMIAVEAVMLVVFFAAAQRLHTGPRQL